MNCKICSKEIAPTNQRGLCKVCNFKEKYPKVNYEYHNQFLKQTKAILRKCGITYEKFSELSGYDYETVRHYFGLTYYSEEFTEVTNELLKKLGY